MSDQELIARLRTAAQKRDEFEAVMLASVSADRIAALTATVERIAKAWPLVRDTDCTGGELAAAIDEIDAAITEETHG